MIFLKNLLSPNTQYRGILIFHGVGVGKSCSGISIAENFKDVYAEKENRIIILASQNIQIGWRKTIFDPRKGDDQCTGETYFFNVRDPSGSGDDDPQIECNFGNAPFSISSGNTDGKYGNFEYAPPSGFYALCTKRLAEFG